MYKCLFITKIKMNKMFEKPKIMVILTISTAPAQVPKSGVTAPKINNHQTFSPMVSLSSNY